MVPGFLDLFKEVSGTIGVSRRTMNSYRDFMGAWARLDAAAATEAA